jgi:hypothetical protein
LALHQGDLTLVTRPRFRWVEETRTQTRGNEAGSFDPSLVVGAKRTGPFHGVRGRASHRWGRRARAHPVPDALVVGAGNFSFRLAWREPGRQRDPLTKFGRAVLVSAPWRTR